MSFKYKKIVLLLIMEDSTIPKDIIKELELKKPAVQAKIVNTIFDKEQAIVRIPTYFNFVLGIKRGSKFKISLVEGEQALKLELIKGAASKAD